MIHPLLKTIDSLDFRNATLTEEFGNLYINSANLLGWGIGTPIAPALRSEMVRIGRKWLEGVKANSAKYTPAEQLQLHNAGDMIYRIAWSAAPDPSVALGVVNKALDARIHGDKEVDIYRLYRLISNGLVCQRKLYVGKPLEWSSIMLDSWYEEFKTGSYRNPKSMMTGRCAAPKITDSDILNRVEILLRADLWAFDSDQKSFKQRLFANHRHYIDDLLSGNAAYDIDTLIALGSFINAAWPKYITTEEQNTYRAATLSAIAAKTASPYQKASIEAMQEADKQLADL